MNSIRLVAVWVIALTVFALITSGNQKLRREIDSEKERADSLQSEVDFLKIEQESKDLEISRYEKAYRIFLRRNQKAAEEYGTIISEETE